MPMRKSNGNAASDPPLPMNECLDSKEGSI